MRWASLLLEVALLSWLSCTASAGVSRVSTATELRQALLDPQADQIVLLAPVTVLPGQWAPISVARAVRVTPAGPSNTLDFAHAQQPLITVAAGGDLLLANLTLAGFQPLQPLPFTSATSLMPVAAVNISSNAASLTYAACVFLSHSPLANVTGSMPFWAAQQHSGLLQLLPAVSSTTDGGSASSDRGSPEAAMLSSPAAGPDAAAAAVMQQRLARVSSIQSFYAGSSTLQVADSLLALDPSSCYNGQSQLVWDSNSLATALQDPAVQDVLVFIDTNLNPLHFSPRRASPASSITISTCAASPATLSFNSLNQAIVMQHGATLKLTGGLRLLQAVPVDARTSRSNSSTPGSASAATVAAAAPALLLMGSVDLSQGATMVLQNVSVAVGNSRQSWQALQDAAEAGWGETSSPVAQQQQQAGSLQLGEVGSGFSVGLWNASMAGVGLTGGSRTYAMPGSRLVLQQVQVVQAAPSCFAAAGGVVAVSDDAELQGLLLNADATMIEVVADIGLHRDHWKDDLQYGVIELKHQVEVRACHPNSSGGGRYTIDFSELQGYTAVNVHSMLRFSGDLILKGLPDRPGAPGSWVLQPSIDLVGSGCLEYEDVVLQGRQPSLLQEPDSAQWEQQGSLAPQPDAWQRLQDGSMRLYRYTLPVRGAAQIFPAMFNSTTLSSSSWHNQQGGSNASHGSYYSFVDVTLTWAPLQAAQQPGWSASTTAALVLGLLLGCGLLVTALAVFVMLRRRRQAALSAELKPLVGHHHAGNSIISINGMQRPLGAIFGSRTMQGAATASFLSSTQGGGNCSVHGGYYNRTADGTDDTTRNMPVDGLWWPSDSAHHPFVQPGQAQHGAPAPSNPSFNHGPQQQPPGDVEWGPHVGGMSTNDRRQSQQQGAFQDKSYRGDRSYNTRDPGAAALLHTTDGNTTATEEGTGGVEGGGGGGLRGQHKQQLFEAARKQLGAVAGDLAQRDALVLESVLGEGTFGKVFKGYWKGTLVAVKTMMFPAAMSGKEKREKMAIMETAISASLSHPNIVQMYTYYLRPVLVGHEAQMATPNAGEGHRLDSSSVGDSTMNAAFLSDGMMESVHSWEVQLVLEYCDQGSLRQLLNQKGSFVGADGGRDMGLILDTALDVARAMLHLHSENIIHSDLKARNILLKSSGGMERCQFVAKVADFGLSMRIDPNATHVSNIYQGTLTHMAPEVMLHGKLSRNSDVYAFGVLLWELYSGGHAFRGIPRALLGHEVAHRQRRPQFPDGSPFDFQLLACRCWESDASIRPSFQEILSELSRMRERIREQEAAAAAAAASNSNVTLPTDSNTVPIVSLGSGGMPAVVHHHQQQQQQQQGATAGSTGGGSGAGVRAAEQQQQQLVAEQAAAASNGGAAGVSGRLPASGTSAVMLRQAAAELAGRGIGPLALAAAAAASSDLPLQQQQQQGQNDDASRDVSRTADESRFDTATGGSNPLVSVAAPAGSAGGVTVTAGGHISVTSPLQQAEADVLQQQQQQPAVSPRQLQQQLQQQQQMLMMQQTHMQRQRRSLVHESIPDSLLRQLSMTESTLSADHPHLPGTGRRLSGGGAAAAAAVGAAAVAAAAASAAAAAAAQLDAGSTTVSTADAKSTYMKDGSTTDDDVVYGMRRATSRGYALGKEDSTDEDDDAGSAGPAAGAAATAAAAAPAVEAGAAAAVAASGNAASGPLPQALLNSQQQEQGDVASSGSRVAALNRGGFLAIGGSHAAQSAPTPQQPLQLHAAPPRRSISDVLPPHTQQQAEAAACRHTSLHLPLQQQEQQLLRSPGQQQQQQYQRDKDDDDDRDSSAGDSRSSVSRSVSDSSGRMLGSTSTSSVQVGHSASAAAIAAVMSLKASLAKQAMSAAAAVAGRGQSPAATPAAAGAAAPRNAASDDTSIDTGAAILGSSIGQLQDSSSRSAPLPAASVRSLPPGAGAAAAPGPGTGQLRSQPLPGLGFGRAAAHGMAAGAGSSAAAAAGGGSRQLLESRRGLSGDGAAAAASAAPAGMRRSSDVRLVSNQAGASTAAAARQQKMPGSRSAGNLSVAAGEADAALQQLLLHSEQQQQPLPHSSLRLSLDARQSALAAAAQQQQQHRPAVRFSLDSRTGGRYTAPLPAPQQLAAVAEAAPDHTRGLGAAGLRSVPGGDYAFAGPGHHAGRAALAPGAAASAAAAAALQRAGQALGTLHSPQPPRWQQHQPKQQGQQQAQQQLRRMPVRKTVSASQLGSSVLVAVPTISEPLNTSQQQPQQQQQVSAGGASGAASANTWLAGSSSSSSQRQQQRQPAAISGLAPDQLQLLQQVADAAKAQVAVASGQLARPSQQLQQLLHRGARQAHVAAVTSADRPFAMPPTPGSAGVQQVHLLQQLVPPPTHGPQSSPAQAQADHARARRPSAPLQLQPPQPPQHAHSLPPPGQQQQQQQQFYR